MTREMVRIGINIAIALVALRTNLMRSILTTLGVMIGVLAVILAVAHAEFVAMGAAGVRALCKPGGVLFDVKHILPKDAVDDRL